MPRYRDLSVCIMNIEADLYEWNHVNVLVLGKVRKKREKTIRRRWPSRCMKLKVP